MKLRNPEGWHDVIAANPVPEDCAADPELWPPYEEMTERQRSDGYGAVVVIAAGRWADAIEAALAAHADLDFPSVATVGDVAESCFADVNAGLGVYSLTVNQYGLAVSILVRVWSYGEELRRWHNLDTQIGDEGERANASGGVLDPAMLGFGPRR